jgi:creatinine amidohydrolase/Fe(II)-dependent formamide hydrolase-like protein
MKNKPDKDPLGALDAFDSLEVGPVKLSKRKVSATYRVRSGNKVAETEFAYVFHEDVFSPRDEADINLASMMCAQVALNYGLFCGEIKIHGVFDNHDMKFLREMMENTSREIYVKKFLEYNPFMKDEVTRLPVLRQPAYTRARLVFANGSKQVKPLKWKVWSNSKLKHCILSSGGKDSLLSYGLLNDIGKETHPIFVNESGRHWFTALNAYRYFKDNIPNTARVWTNSDRVFSFMLRQMPFVRQDFAKIRSDEYPVRLWTVAVFIYAVLPLMKKRGIGRLIVGDEYDTTRKTSFQKISHYDGLFDQSRYFDEYHSRYFFKKGWAISQFSVLRTLAEINIQAILARRYPLIQKQQVSCHAAHKEGDRIYPCGKCEKCRRIVGILKAMDGNPENCGYTPGQIEHCLDELGSKPVHQIGPDARHLSLLLTRKGLIRMKESAMRYLRESPETMKLRFDPERSPMGCMPTDLRKPLFSIYLQYSDGAVIKKGRKWLDFRPLQDPSIEEYYPFEFDPDVAEKFSTEVRRGKMDTYLWGEMTWPEAKERLSEVDIVLLPVGSIEQHGPHLPLDTDSYDAEYLAKRVSEACSDPKPLVLPLVPYGVSYHHEDFKGTISVTNDALSKFIYDIGMSLASNGIRKLVIINGHGDNSPTLRYAAQMINRDAKIFTCVDTGESSDIDIARISETEEDVHAGEVETSTSLATRPRLVRMELAKAQIPTFNIRYLGFSSARGIPWYAHTSKISESGVMGDPTRASAEKGEKIWEVMIAHLVAFVEDLKGMTLEEIYQKRY